jgi:hypothetical protein
MPFTVFPGESIEAIVPNKSMIVQMSVSGISCGDRRASIVCRPDTLKWAAFKGNY